MGAMQSESQEKREYSCLEIDFSSGVFHKMKHS